MQGDWYASSGKILNYWLHLGSRWLRENLLFQILVISGLPSNEDHISQQYNDTKLAEYLFWCIHMHILCVCVSDIWGMYSWNPFEDAHSLLCCNNYKKIPQVLDRTPIDAQVSVSHLERIPWAAAWSLVPQPPHVVLQCECMAFEYFFFFFTSLKMWKSHGQKSGLYAGCSSTSYCIGFIWSWSLNSVGHMGLGMVVRQVNAVCEFVSLSDVCSWSWYLGFEAFDDNGLHWLCQYGIWSPEVWILWCQRTQSTSLHGGCLWFTNLWSEWGDGLPLHACFSTHEFKLRHHVSLPTTVRHRNVSSTVWYHCECSSDIDMQCSLCVSVIRCQTHWEHFVWYLRSRTISWAVLILRFSSADREGKVQCLSMHTTFLTHTLFSRLVTVRCHPSLRMSSVCCPPVHNIQRQSSVIQYTFITIDCTHWPVNFVMLTSLCSKKLNHHHLVLLGGFSNWYAIFKLC
jgi:hypothetical protein